MAIDQETLLRHVFAERLQLVGYIRAIVRDRHVAEDIYQDVSILAVKKLDEIPSVEALPGWLRKTARYESLNAVRKLQRDRLVFDDAVLDLLDGQWTTQDGGPGSSDLLDALDVCMGELTDHARHILHLRYRENLTGDQLADAMSRPKNTVYVAMTRAHTSLAECIRQRTANRTAGLSHD